QSRWRRPDSETAALKMRTRARGILRLPVGSVSLRLPRREPRGHEIAVETEHVAAPRGFHDREAHRVGIGDLSGTQPYEPAQGRGVVLGRGEVNRDAGTRPDSIERLEGGIHPGAVQSQPV